MKRQCNSPGKSQKGWYSQNGKLVEGYKLPSRLCSYKQLDSWKDCDDR